MIIGVDFDGTVIDQNEQFEDSDVEELQLLPDAREGLEALKRAGHILILFSGRANRAHREDWRLNPLWRDGVVPFDEKRWEKNRPIFEARYQAMLEFVARELPGIFDAIDDGQQGKLADCDLWIDDKSIGRWGYDCSWSDVIQLYGERT
jgi:phosphoglycolate phosphatase-like HAD superfamily hydrolase